MSHRTPRSDERFQERRIQGSTVFPCAYYRAASDEGAPADFYVPYHWHDSLEIIHIQSGEFLVDLDLEEHPVTEETFLFVAPGTIHSLRARAPYRESALVFHLSLLTSGHPDAMTADILNPLQSGRLRLPSRITASDLSVFPSLKEEYLRLEQLFLLANACTNDQYHVDAPASQLRVKAGLLNILAILADSSTLTASLASEDRRSLDLKAALSYMEDHFQEKIYLSDLASTANMNEQYFCRSFRKAFGETPIGYLNHIRLRQAAKLLLETDRSVTAVALDCGFHNLGHFQAKFRELTGKTPLQYRRSASGLPPLS